MKVKVTQPTYKDENEKKEAIKSKTRNLLIAIFERDNKNEHSGEKVAV